MGCRKANRVQINCLFEIRRVTHSSTFASPRKDKRFYQASPNDGNCGPSVAVKPTI